MTTTPESILDLAKRDPMDPRVPAWLSVQAQAAQLVPRCVPKCDGEAGCDKPVTHLDTAGFGYCTDHGIWRRQYEPCRKLTPAELNRLARGQQIEKY